MPVSTSSASRSRAKRLLWPPQADQSAHWLGNSPSSLAHEPSASPAAPKNAAILDSMGWVLFRQGRPGEALPYLSAAYADDHDGDIAAHLGEVLWQLGRQGEAQRVWSEASALDADNQLLKSTRQRLHAEN